MRSLVVVCLVALLATPVAGATASLSRQTRAVTPEEIAGGAPAGGFVHEFFITSASDLLLIGQVEVDAPLYQHKMGNDVAPAYGDALRAAPALSADSFITLPSETSSIGGGFNGSPGEHVWFDLANTGPQQDFLFARMTTAGATGSFSGWVSLRTQGSYVPLPFDFLLPGTEADLARLHAEPTYRLEYSLDAPPLPTPVTPPAPSLPTPTLPGPTLPQPPQLPPVATAPTHPSSPIPEPPMAPPGASVASARLSRTTRAVTDAEVAGGAPLGGFVHEFFVTSSSDLLLVGQVKVDAPLYQHTMGSDVAPASGESLAAASALSADSFITLPGQTSSIGGGFDDSPGDHAWFDISNDGAQEDFLFARLTTAGETGSFSGYVSLRGYDGYVPLPFDFVLPGNEADLALLAGEPTYAKEYSFNPPAIPEPPALPEPTTDPVPGPVYPEPTKPPVVVTPPIVETPPLGDPPGHGYDPGVDPSDPSRPDESEVTIVVIDNPAEWPVLRLPVDGWIGWPWIWQSIDVINFDPLVDIDFTPGADIDIADGGTPLVTTTTFPESELTITFDPATGVYYFAPTNESDAALTTDVDFTQLVHGAWPTLHLLNADGAAVQTAFDATTLAVTEEQYIAWLGLKGAADGGATTGLVLHTFGAAELTVPEPSTAALTGLAIAAAGVLARRRARNRR